MSQRGGLLRHRKASRSFDPTPMVTDATDATDDAPGGDDRGIALRFPASPRRYAAIAVGLAVVFAVVQFGAQIADLHYGVTLPEWWHETLDVDAEATLPAWFSGAQFLLMALAFATIGAQYSDARHREFLLAAAVVVVASIDEVVSLHERGAELLNGVIDVGPPFGRAWWVVPGLAVVLGIAFALRHLPKWLGRPTATRVGVGIGVYFFGALMLEAVGGSIEPRTITYAAEVTLEEFAEMVGQTIVLFALFLHIKSRAPADTG